MAQLNLVLVGTIPPVSSPLSATNNCTARSNLCTKLVQTGSSDVAQAIWITPYGKDWPGSAWGAG